jgi:hypothetical protein
MFDSYYGYPKLSDFSIEQSANSYSSILVDVLPLSPVNENYFVRSAI